MTLERRSLKKMSTSIQCQDHGQNFAAHELYASAAQRPFGRYRNLPRGTGTLQQPHSCYSAVDERGHRMSRTRARLTYLGCLRRRWRHPRCSFGCLHCPKCLPQLTPQERQWGRYFIRRRLSWHCRDFARFIKMSGSGCRY